MKRIAVLLLFLLQFGFADAQSPWPSESWNAATPLTAAMNSAGLLELSGLHWNSENNRLYVVHGDGRLRVLELNTATNTFTQIGNKTISGGPEGITQANLAANEFYTIDENNYEIRKYTHTANFSTVNEFKHWDLLQSPSPMTDTGNTGPEGIVFVPDANLFAIGFVSSETELPYTSVKGAGGLFFVAHQNGGYVWVFDINPNVNNDFAYVGKYKTNRTESCDLSFDRSTGLLYILHNVGNNYIEVTDLTLAATAETKFATISEYSISNPADGNVNIEGFAITPKCNAAFTGSAWLCRDVESGEEDAVKEDAIRWFNPYTEDGDCAPLATVNFTNQNAIAVSPNPGTDLIALSGNVAADCVVRFIDISGKVVLKNAQPGKTVFDVSTLQNGIYLIEVSDGQKSAAIKWIKQ